MKSRGVTWSCCTLPVQLNVTVTELTVHLGFIVWFHEWLLTTALSPVNSSSFLRAFFLLNDSLLPLPSLALLSEDATYQVGIKLCANEEFIDFSIFPSVFCKLKPNHSPRKKHLVKKRGGKNINCKRSFIQNAAPGAWYSWTKPGGTKWGCYNINQPMWWQFWTLHISIYSWNPFCPLQRILLTDPTHRATKQQQ